MGSESNKTTKTICYLASILCIVGGLNWGTVGALDLDLVALIFGEKTILARIVYCTVGVAAAYKLIWLTKSSTSSCSKDKTEAKK